MILVHGGVRGAFVCLVLLLTACRSAKPPAPAPAAITEAEHHTAQATGLSAQQNWPAAAAEWKRAAEQFSLLNDPAREAIALHNQGEAEMEQAHFEAARLLLARAADLNTKSGHEQEWWRNQIGLLQTEAALTNQAAALDNRVQDLSSKLDGLKQPLTRALLLNELGLWHLRRKEWPEATANLQASEQFFQQAGDALGLAAVVANQALVAEYKEDFVTAEKLWRDALGRYEKAAQPAGIAQALHGLGRSLLKQMKNLPEAEDLLRRAAVNFGLLKRAAEQKAAETELSACLEAEKKNKKAD